MAENNNCSEDNLNDALENASILKTVKIISRWMQAMEEKRALQGDCDESAGKEASTELKSSELEMIEFFKSFKEELYRTQQSEKIEFEVNDEESLGLLSDNTSTDEIDQLLLNSRARANSTFQTVKYIGRWMKAVDRCKTGKQKPVTELSIPEEENESEFSLDDDDDEDDEEKGEEEMIRFFRSLKLDKQDVTALPQVDEETLPCKMDNTGKTQNADDSDKMQNEGVEGKTEPKDVERKAIVMNTVKFVIKWMEKAETNKMKGSTR